MLDNLPGKVEPLSLAVAGRTFIGKLRLSEFARLPGLLEESTGHVDVRLVFEIDSRQLPVMRGSVSGKIALVCQRCMDQMSFDLDVSFLLALMTSANETTELPEGYESLLISGESVALSDLIEDEIILSLPLISAHPDEEQCQAFVEHRNTTQKEISPFAVLEKLKK
ncbi:MAG: YceD family protein [Gammaproteobacteria bacterium]